MYDLLIKLFDRHNKYSRNELLKICSVDTRDKLLDFDWGISNMIESHNLHIFEVDGEVYYYKTTSDVPSQLKAKTSLRELLARDLADEKKRKTRSLTKACIVRLDKDIEYLRRITP